MSVLSGSADEEIFLMIILNDVICKMMSFYMSSIINIRDIGVLTYLKVLIVFCKHINNSIYDRIFLNRVFLQSLNVINVLKTDVRIYLIVIIVALL